MNMMKLKKTLKLIIVLTLVVLLLQVYQVGAKNPKAKILYVGYCDLDADGKFDDVYAEVHLTMWEGTNYLTIEANVEFRGDLLYSIYRDNHVRTETEIVYRFYFYSIIFVEGYYLFSVWFEIENGDKSGHTYAVKAFDPPGGDPDYPAGGGLDPGP